MDYIALESRIARLEQRQRRAPFAHGLTLCIGIMVAAAGSTVASQRTQFFAEIRTHKLVVLDSLNRHRVEIGEDDEDIERQHRQAGVVVFDAKGNERGGMGTGDDGSAVIALDAPHGVGSPMPDRAGMKVAADGSAVIAVLSNSGEFAASLSADQDAGAIELAQRDAGASQRFTRTLTTHGDTLVSSVLND